MSLSFPIQHGYTFSRHHLPSLRTSQGSVCGSNFLRRCPDHLSFPPSSFSSGRRSVALHVAATHEQPSERQHQPPQLSVLPGSAPAWVGPESTWEALNGRTAVIVGAGPAGCTLAMHLAKAGWRVRVYEKRPEPGPATSSRQRSWVLAMYPRGIRPVKAVAEVPLLKERAYKGLVVGVGNPDKKPIVLERTGILMDRTLLATSLLDAARGQYGSRLEFTFKSPLESVDFSRQVAIFHNGTTAGSSDSSSISGAAATTTFELVGTSAGHAAAAGAAAATQSGILTTAVAEAESRNSAPQAVEPLVEVPYDLLVGADGSNSTVRALLSEAFPGQYVTTVLGNPGGSGPGCYKSVYGLPPVPKVEAWAPDSAVPSSERLQGEFFFALTGGKKGFISMCRDIDGSYCGYLAAGENIFAELCTREDYLNLLPQAGPQLPAEWLPLLADKLLAAPLSNFPVMRSLPRFCAPGGVVLVGDAAHTVTPTLGQGLNSALEDCELLVEDLRRGALAAEEGAAGIEVALHRFSESRVPQIRALQELELLQSSSLTPLSSAQGKLLPLMQLLVRKWIVIQYSGLALLGTFIATAQAASRKKKHQRQEPQRGDERGDLQEDSGGSCNSRKGSTRGLEAAAEMEAAARADVLGRQLDATYVRSPPMYELLRGHMEYKEMLVRVYSMAALGTGLTVAMLYGLCSAGRSLAERIMLA